MDERVDERGRAEVVVGERAVPDRRERLCEGRDVLGLDRQPRRGGVPAPALEVARALPQPVCRSNPAIERPEPFQFLSVPAISTTGRA